jgi:hypothetical protein
MTDNCSVIFRGDIVLGKNLVDVKQKLAQLFKVDDARIERLFTGKPVPLKANTSLAQAKKYQAILNQAGIVTAIIDNFAANANSVSKTSAAKKTAAASIAPVINTDANAIASVLTATSSKTATTIVAPTTGFSLAPAGSDLLDGKQQAPVAPVDTAHLSLSPQEGNIVKEDERLAPLPATIDIDSLEWDIADAGETLLKESEREKIEPLYIDTNDLSISDVGSTLLKKEDRHPAEEVDVDISHIKLAPHNPFM